jgi:hypothetical protein
MFSFNTQLGSTASEDLDHLFLIQRLEKYDKCAILCIGSLKNTTFTLSCSLLIKWSDGDVDILGIQWGEQVFGVAG